jgi:hypothetical protein
LYDNRSVYHTLSFGVAESPVANKWLEGVGRGFGLRFMLIALGFPLSDYCKPDPCETPSS